MPRMTTVSPAVGRRAAELRRIRGLTTRALDDRLSELGHRIPQSSLTKIERGTQAVTVDDLVALAQALNCSPGWLLGLDGAPPPPPPAICAPPDSSPANHVEVP